MTLIGFDCETHLITPGNLAPKLVSLQLYGKGRAPFPTDPSRHHMIRQTGNYWGAILTGKIAAKTFARLLSSDARLVAHNAPFDLAVLVKALIALGVPSYSVYGSVFDSLDSGRLADTLVREKLLSIAQGNYPVRRRKMSLADLVKHYFSISMGGKEGDDIWRLRYSELEHIPPCDWPVEAQDYALDDAMWAYKVHEAQVTDPYVCPQSGICAVQDGRVVDETPQTRAAFDLHLMAVRGTRTDPVWVNRTINEWKKVAARGLQIGEDAGFIRVKGRDKGKPGSKIMSKLRDRVEAAYTRTGVDVPRTPKGAVQTSRDVLARSGDEVLKAYAETTEYTGYLTKYADILVNASERPLNSRPNVLVETGRTSWSKPPYQQPPRKGGFRECHVPSPGFVYISVDYDQIELVCMAQNLLDLGLGSAMADAINEGKDLHALLASDLLGWPYEKVMESYKAGGETASEFRQIAKIGNYGYMGGMRGWTFVKYAANQGTDLPGSTLQDKADFAERLRNLFIQRWDGMDAYFHMMKRALEVHDRITIQQFVSKRVRGNVGYTDGCNGFFQGRAADGCKAAIAAVTRESYADPTSPLYGSRPILFLHDEILLEAPEEKFAEAGDRMADVMREEMQEYLPDVTVGCEPAAMRRWYKKAKTLRDSSGKLMLWEPA